MVYERAEGVAPAGRRVVLRMLNAPGLRPSRLPIQDGQLRCDARFRGRPLSRSPRAILWSPERQKLPIQVARLEHLDAVRCEVKKQGLPSRSRPRSRWLGSPRTSPDLIGRVGHDMATTFSTAHRRVGTLAAATIWTPLATCRVRSALRVPGDARCPDLCPGGGGPSGPPPNAWGRA